jgi:ribonuclease HI
MEIQAAIQALQKIQTSIHAPTQIGIQIVSDSMYLIDGITKWIRRWKQTGWTTSQGGPVANAEDWRALDEAVQAVARPIQWVHSRGHVGVHGNERADEIATAFSARRSFDLYSGPISGYGLTLENLGDLTPHGGASAAKKKSGSSNAKPLCYASLVGGKAERHATWAECEARVKGKPAKYKKVFSEEELAQLYKEWGVKK